MPLRVIMITANEGSRHKAYAEMLGVDDYIRKPFAMDRLMDSVESAAEVATGQGPESCVCPYSFSYRLLTLDSRPSTKRDRPRQWFQHAAGDVVVDHVSAEGGQAVDRFDVRLVRYQATVLPAP